MLRRGGAAVRAAGARRAGVASPARRLLATEHGPVPATCASPLDPSRDGVYRRPLEPVDQRELGVHWELVFPDAAGPEPILDIDQTTDRKTALASMLAMLAVMAGVGLAAQYFHGKRDPVAVDRDFPYDNLAAELGGTANCTLKSPGARVLADKKEAELAAASM